MTQLVKSNAELRSAMTGLANNICLVPTMGALHEGHAALIKAGKEKVGNNGCVVVSDFVNPKQFGKNEDFENYPRDLEKDFKVAHAAGAHILWAPSAQDVYPGQWPLDEVKDQRFEILEGASRPGHFAAVVEVVSRLFDIVQPRFAVFGEKDFQQLVFIKDLARKRNPVVEIISVPTVREKDGLAMSSRNIYLSSDQRNIAHLIPDSLRNATLLASKGVTQSEVKSEVIENLKKTDLIELDYVEIVDNELGELNNNELGRILIAAKLGNTRLIDNMPIMFKVNS